MRKLCLTGNVKTHCAMQIILQHLAAPFQCNHYGALWSTVNNNEKWLRTLTSANVSSNNSSIVLKCWDTMSVWQSCIKRINCVMACFLSIALYRHQHQHQHQHQYQHQYQSEAVLAPPFWGPGVYEGGRSLEKFCQLYVQTCSFWHKKKQHKVTKF